MCVCSHLDVELILHIPVMESSRAMYEQAFSQDVRVYYDSVVLSPETSS
jgi:hypothetical protein